MLVGYARTSTVEQVAGFEAQLKVLADVGCEKIFKEQVSSVDVVARDQLASALDFVRTGDTLIVTKIDRMARNTLHLLTIAKDLKAKGVHLRILDPALDTASPFGELMLTLIGGIAQFEREIMLERQREGIAKAKGLGKYRGRAATAQAKADEVMALKAEGVGPVEIAKRLKIGRASVYRIIDAAKGPAVEVEAAQTGMDAATEAHFAKWLDEHVADAEREGVEAGIRGVLADDPTLVDGRSWPELRTLAGC